MDMSFVERIVNGIIFIKRIVCGYKFHQRNSEWNNFYEWNDYYRKNSVWI